MPQIAQQDYKVIAPKDGRAFNQDAAALAELKKSILNGIGFDCILKDMIASDGSIGRVIGLILDGSVCHAYDPGNEEIMNIVLPYTVSQYQGLAAVQNAEDEEIGLQDNALPELTNGIGGGYLGEDNESVFICVGGKYLTVTGGEAIEALTIAETGPTEYFINITWEDAQKLIGLPLI